ncbi:MAG: dihydroxyacetone kinase subunit DhaK [Clostridiales Family XIII bacterium]|jgi:dihydroxyacetone kinase|nr:dihydroxyacetone kinase subunit DhaK [Clostridiales Family XIII bacterium]
MKKIINGVEHVVDEMARGFVRAHAGLTLDDRYRIVYRAASDGRVTLISGGGSGHEPAHAGFVGEGMLTAAVCGDVFASPSSIQIYNAILKTESKKGALLIIKNYSGDRMNFESAAEFAADDDIEVEKVYVNDDIAVEDSLYTVGRRGVAGTLFVHKIAGAAAERGFDLPEVKRLAEKAASSVRSIGVALTSCTVPANGTPTFSLADDEAEFGVGIHGEPGVERQTLRDAKTLAEDMVGRLSDELGLASGDEVCVMVNGLGATPLMELYIAFGNVAELLEGRGVNLHRPLVGNYMTALDMAGFSLTLLKLDDELKSLLDDPADAPAWKL